MPSLRRLRPSRTTWALLVLAAGTATWAHLDAQDEDAPRATLVSTRSAAWRVLPEIANTDVAGATVELWPSRGEPVRLVPEGLGHQVRLGEEVLGPADPDAMEGVWDSLRLATTLRAVDDDAGVSLGAGGRIVVGLPAGGARTIVLGPPTVDGAGVYGSIEGGAEGTEGQWVLEHELSVLVQQAPETWLARRAVVAEPADLVGLTHGGLTLRRGIDGLWRSRLGDGSAAILDRVAVETRLDRLLSARLDPLVEPREGAGEPWVTLEGVDGTSWTLRTHGACPGRDDRVLVDRGPGRWGCIDAALVRPWPVPGQPDDERSSMLDPRLVPHEYGRVLRIEQRAPGRRTLRRYGGGWRIEEDLDGRTAVFDVPESEAFRWYRALHEAEVSPDADPSWPESPAVDLTLVTDSTATLRLRCTDEQPRRCRRDDGPVLRLRQAVPPLAFDTETFAERMLVSLRSEDVRAVEILADDDRTVVRQSVHFDLGVWRLDAPVHPAGDLALDELRLEALLGALGGLRADAWVELPADASPRRRLRVERIPRRGQDPVLEIELHDDCMARVEGQRPARLSEGACQTLGHDLLVEMPIVRALLGARALELTLTPRGETTRLTPRGEAWADEAGGPAPEANAWLAGWEDRTSPTLRAGAAPTAVEWTLRVLPTKGTPYAYEGGPGWLRIRDASWWYAITPDDGSEEPGALDGVRSEEPDHQPDVGVGDSSDPETER